MRLRHRSWTKEVLEGNKDISRSFAELKEDSLKEFDHLEIGCGLGGFLLSLSKEDPSGKYLGVEVSLNAFAAAVKKASAVKKDQKNFLIVHAPIERLFPYLPTGRLEAIYINFPDPWPKKRQVHRRLSSPKLLKEYHRLLKRGGKIYFRTDNAPLFEDSTESFVDSGLFKVETVVPFLSETVDFLPSTEYERKFREKGLPIHLLIATKE